VSQTVLDAGGVRSLAFAVAITLTTIAVAEPVEPTEADRIFLQGRELAKLGRFDEACALFARSYELDPALGTAVNLADCLERQGHFARAWALFDVVARDSQSVQSRARLARERADALQARLATVVITLRDPGAAGLHVRLGDRPVTPAAEIRDLIEPRDTVLVATVPGRPVFKTMVHAVAGATLAVEIPAFAPAARDEPLAPTRRRRSRVYLAAAIDLAGVAGLGVSLGYAVSARRIYNSAFDHDCEHTDRGASCSDRGKATIDRAGARADVATGLAIAGAVLAGVGAVVFIMAPRDAIEIAPIATSHELGLGLSGRF
jgi:tetratricopeptide (TPR) repeat protein